MFTLLKSKSAWEFSFVTNFPVDIYIVKVNGIEVKKFTKE